jgi:hypothetical protein
MPNHRSPYVTDSDPAEACRRSAQIDREEAHTLDADDPRRAELFASAEQWEAQAATGERPAYSITLQDHGDRITWRLDRDGEQAESGACMNSSVRDGYAWPGAFIDANNARRRAEGDIR